MAKARSAEGQTTLITGASGGIGLELATVCAEHGMELVLVARNREGMEIIARNLKEKYNVNAFIIDQDLSKTGGAAKVADIIHEKGIEIDVLINNAGFGQSGAFSNSDLKRTQEMMQVNMVTLTQLTRLLLPAMVRRGKGRILNVASTAAFLPGPFMAVYYATKAYVLSFSEALADELRKTGVTVTALCPGPTQTRFSAEAKMQDSRLFNRTLSAREVAEAGYSGMMKGKPVVVVGARNKAVAWAPRFVPRRVAMKAVRKAHELRD